VLKFVVVLYRKPGLDIEEFHTFLREVHGPMAEALPDLSRYIQNHVVPDPSRKHPGWDAVVELYWSDRESMEAAWKSAEGQAATADLELFADLSRSTWSIVEEDIRR
jgi:uncharacterized protein (TIGR02118 family)